MSEIALYDTLRKIPDVSAAEAKEAVADIANTRDVATKTDIAKLETRLTWRVIVIVGIAVATLRLSLM